MKQYIMIIFIALHLMSSTLYATKSFLNQDSVDFNTHECSFHEHAHEHHHTHNGSTHKHNHTQTHINLLDFFVHVDNNKQLTALYSKQKYLENIYFISNPKLESIFRPPIV